LLPARLGHYGSFVSRGLVVGVALFAIAAPAASAPPGIVLRTTAREAQGNQAFAVTGAVASGRSGEDITIEIHECSSPAPFHAAGGAQTGAGGTFSTQIGLLSSSQVRARWRLGVSDPISVQVHPYMTLTYKGPSRYFVWIRADDFFGGARAVLERLAGDKWVTVKKFTVGRAPSSGVASSTATVRAKLKKRTIIRAVLPKAQAGRCYLAGFTNTLKV
jgi:hypothetical protein